MLLLKENRSNLVFISMSFVARVALPKLFCSAEGSTKFFLMLALFITTSSRNHVVYGLLGLSCGVYAATSLFFIK